jgi:hypothetical protein
MYCYLNYICVEHFYWAGSLGPSVWEPGPKILGGHAGAPKTDLPMPLLATGGAGRDALRFLKRQSNLMPDVFKNSFYRKVLCVRRVKPNPSPGGKTTRTKQSFTLII